MKASKEIDAVTLQHEAAYLFYAARARIAFGDMQGALRDQERSAMTARFARIMIGVTNGDMRNATQ